ncbi:MAG: hypothetical protein OEO84_11535 [Betaproteobacteria bacterium]|nr:hypothetical protein [Betaproteobacteria bacterium]
MKAAAAIFGALLAGCALLRPDAGEALQVRDILGGAVSAVRATPEEQRRRLVHAQQMYAAAPDDMNRLRLAAMLVTLPPPWRDDGRAASLLEPLATRRTDSPVAELASMLAASVAERQRLARELRAAMSRAEAAESQSEAAKRREEVAAERAGTLQRQLDALKAIERSILEREERHRNQRR